MVMRMCTQRGGTGKEGAQSTVGIAPSTTAKCGALRCAAAPFILLSKVDSPFRQVVHGEFQRYPIARKDANVILVNMTGRASRSMQSSEHCYHGPHWTIRD